MNLTPEKKGCTTLLKFKSYLQAAPSQVESKEMIDIVCKTMYWEDNQRVPTNS